MSQLGKENMLFAYKTLIKEDDKHFGFMLGKSLGYLEACLQHFSALQIHDIGNGNELVRETVKSRKWWKKDRLETNKEAITRMCEKYFEDNGINYKD